MTHFFMRIIPMDALNLSACIYVYLCMFCRMAYLCITKELGVGLLGDSKRTIILRHHLVIHTHCVHRKGPRAH